ncbi:TIGR01244 family sulfur transferase [Erythrobacter sp.]|uniref:TIGR01244 family sulfur transferase n=1 Tax=Erythrobacter sp. TaxID=1042 RepID=UPI002ED23364
MRRRRTLEKFRPIAGDFFASPQIDLADIDRAKAMGVAAIVNNRPDGEEPAAPQGAEIEAAARAAGIDYTAIPVGHAGFSEPQIDALVGVLSRADGPVLGYCRSGTRSTLLWALAQAKSGADPDEIASAAAAQGYDVGPVRPMMDMLAAR